MRFKHYLDAMSCANIINKKTEKYPKSQEYVVIENNELQTCCKNKMHGSAGNQNFNLILLFLG